MACHAEERQNCRHTCRINPTTFAHMSNASGLRSVKPKLYMKKRFGTTDLFARWSQFLYFFKIFFPDAIGKKGWWQVLNLNHMATNLLCLVNTAYCV